MARQVGGQSLRALLEVVGVGDHEAARALGQVGQRPLEIEAQGRLRGLGGIDLVLADRAGAAVLHGALAHALGLGERVLRRGHRALDVEPAGVDRVHAHVRAVGGADRRAEDGLEVRRHL